MRNLLFAVILATVSFTTAVCAQGPQILASSPPVYQPGETFIGQVEFKPGVVAEMREYAQLSSDGKVYVHTDTISNGVIVSQLTADPTTMLVTGKSSTWTQRTLSTTCMPDKFFPVYIGKQVTCSTVTQMNNDPPETASQWFMFTRAERDPTGKITAICSTDAGPISTSDTCSTPDLKWIRRVVIKQLSSL